MTHNKMYIYGLDHIGVQHIVVTIMKTLDIRNFLSITILIFYFQKTNDSFDERHSTPLRIRNSKNPIQQIQKDKRTDSYYNLVISSTTI